MYGVRPMEQMGEEMKNKFWHFAVAVSFLIPGLCAEASRAYKAGPGGYIYECVKFDGAGRFAGTFKVRMKGLGNNWDGPLSKYGGNCHLVDYPGRAEAERMEEASLREVGEMCAIASQCRTGSCNHETHTCVVPGSGW